MANVTDRIKQLIEIKNLTPSKLADTIKVNRSRLSHILTGRNNPSLEMVQSILNCFPDINPEWLLFGQGNTFRDESTSNSITFGSLFDQETASELKFTEKAQNQVKKTGAQESEIPEESKHHQVYQEKQTQIFQKSEVTTSNHKEDRKPSKRRIKMITVFYDDNEYEILYPEN